MVSGGQHVVTEWSVSGQPVVSALRLTRGAAVVVTASRLSETDRELLFLSNGRMLPRLDIMPATSARTSLDPANQTT